MQDLSRQFESYTFDVSYKNVTVKENIIKLEEFAEGPNVPSSPLIPEAFKSSFVFRAPPRDVSAMEAGSSRDYDEAALRYGKCGEQATVEWAFIGPFLDCKYTHLRFTVSSLKARVSQGHD